jgi:hypothetical protein
MKNIFLAIAMVFAMGFSASAQSDSFFNDWENVGNGMDRTGLEMPTLPGSHGITDDVTAPLGGGLLILTALGGAYLLRRREK